MSLKPSHPSPRSWRDYLSLIAQGFLIGTVDAVPGVSGGTVALLLGIYEELIRSIRSMADLKVVRKLFRPREWGYLWSQTPWRFLLAVVLGILGGAFTLAHTLEWALIHHPQVVWALFFGFVLASTLLVSRRVQRWKPHYAGLFLAGGAVAFALAGAMALSTPKALWAFFLSGFAAICAMILPGVSGALVLVLLGKYQDVLNAVTSFQVLPLVVFGLGALLGLSLMVRLLTRLLRRYHDATLTFLCGLMAGSLRRLWPWKAWGEEYEETTAFVEMVNNTWPSFTELETWGLLGLMGVGFVVVWWLERLAHGRSGARSSTSRAILMGGE
jgi:putative membrane protein